MPVTIKGEGLESPAYVDKRDLVEDEIDLESQELTDESLMGADAVVVLTDHTSLPYDRVLTHAEVLVDARHVVPRPSQTGAGAGSTWIVKH